ncbi:tRNA (N(6)-L-threonylcarbamoyladenosine(37)-C(2))-methylthiotransferase MtaB [Desulfofustis glycolicus]|uniref:Threonylcarbamoyladenosine tRNA methylthiotransferase MtaB n=1 Tax=Desulfofustis glycolicus DSM 9705 TaxID=1121409 RepID=A0A1M5XLH2_9BACT|nr:tRNA (N(6)-L-threonylcarbamoyladenosine(37)-C(2))-methylthiotransferase MtaB [Desulfofustis glycolicus]MCB2216646.1 tRNA (N(6)-L-threonylcarbamoyladenosine(37)-C(2))-methylthiotransferase MtaB [Desulfobulbaceae bacterium]SHI00695.1 threonylcarbamoyladenosine tRNA methylthiotransferase MtaB [Desulfofustis glycolicus DSM 9705]
MKRVYFHTLGCKVNQFETASFASDFIAAGFTVSADPAHADVIVINTCAVTAKASSQSRRDLGRLARNNPGALLVVTGCQAQFGADELRRLPGMDSDRLLLIGNDAKDSLLSRLTARRHYQADPRLVDMNETRTISRLAVGQFTGRTRALLRVQDGCNNFCSYCIVPLTRGRSRSLPLEEVIAQTASYAGHGHHEVVVTGIHVGQYGTDFGTDFGTDLDIADLMTALCERFPRLRFRLSSIEPTEISMKLLTLMQQRDNFMPHLHIPLQSGDNQILARMNRHYTREQFIEKLALCRQIVPDAAIGIDVLVGFPGEQETHFNNTMAVLEQTDCTYLHAFPYSPRPGTRATDFAGQVEQTEKQHRVRLVRTFGEQRKASFYSRFLGSRRSAVIEAERDHQGLLRGYTDNYIPIHLAGDDALINSVVTVELEQLAESGVTAHLGGSVT